MKRFSSGITNDQFAAGLFPQRVETPEINLEDAHDTIKFFYPGLLASAWFSGKNTVLSQFNTVKDKISSLRTAARGGFTAGQPAPAGQ